MNIIMKQDPLRKEKVGMSAISMKNGLGVPITHPYELAQRLGHSFINTIRTDISSEGTLDVLIQTGDDVLKTFMSIIRTDTTGMQIDLYEDVTVSDVGTEAFTYIPNRINGVEPLTSVYENPTIDDIGTKIDENEIVGEQGIGGRRIGTGIADPMHTPYKRNTNYILRFTNLETNTIRFVYRLVAYETEEV